MKKAFLVEYCIRTRVVADVPEDFDPDKKSITEEIIVAKAGDKIINDAQAYVISDNVISIEEDLEMPYDPDFDDKPKSDVPKREYSVLLRTGDYLKDGDRIVTFESEESAAAKAKEVDGITVSLESWR